MSNTDLQRLCGSICIGKNIQENIEIEELEKKPLLKKDIRIGKYTITSVYSQNKRTFEDCFLSYLMKKKGLMD